MIPNLISMTLYIGKLWPKNAKFSKIEKRRSFTGKSLASVFGQNIFVVAAVGHGRAQTTGPKSTAHNVNKEGCGSAQNVTTSSSLFVARGGWKTINFVGGWQQRTHHHSRIRIEFAPFVCVGDDSNIIEGEVQIRVED